MTLKGKYFPIALPLVKWESATKRVGRAVDRCERNKGFGAILSKGETGND